MRVRRKSAVAVTHQVRHSDRTDVATCVQAATAAVWALPAGAG